MISYKNTHNKTFKFRKQIKKTTLFSIDYLIINLEGEPANVSENDLINFKFEKHNFGNKLFANMYNVYFKNEKIGLLQTEPRSPILSPTFSQFQFENHLFYTKKLIDLKSILIEMLELIKFDFIAVNRLDLALDKNDDSNFYRYLTENILNNNYLLSGRSKNIQSHYETFKGKSVLNGSTYGKRSSAKLVRIYNKSLSLQINEKNYINDWHKNNGLKSSNVWRFEIQLNATFFSKLYVSQINQFYQNIDVKSVNYQLKPKVITFEIFDYANLFAIYQTSLKGFFDVYENSNKSQITKNKIVQIFDFNEIKQNYTCSNAILNKLEKNTLSTKTIHKRLAKSLFREYYCNNQDVSYIIALNTLLLNNDIETNLSLKSWFDSKVKFYFIEFQQKEKLIKQFDKNLFFEHQNIFL